MICEHTLCFLSIEIKKNFYVFFWSDIDMKTHIIYIHINNIIIKKIQNYSILIV